MARDDLIGNLGVSPDKCRVIYNPVVSEKIQSLANSDTEDDDWLFSNVSVILGVGRLHHQKGFDTLIKAFAHTIKNRDARLIILGSSSQAEYLEELVALLGVSHLIRFRGFKLSHLRICISHLFLFSPPGMRAYQVF